MRLRSRGEREAEEKERKEEEEEEPKPPSSKWWQELFSFEQSGLQFSAINEVRSLFCVQSDNEMPTDVFLKFLRK